MASAKIQNTIKNVETSKKVEEYTLTLSKEEAQVLKTVLGRTAGVGGSESKTADSIWYALDNAGISLFGTGLSTKLQGELVFKTTSNLNFF